MASRGAKSKWKVAYSKWSNDAYIELFYQMAKEVNGEVDHIVPLNHPLVCGLHNENNLQVTTKGFNFFKRNLIWPDMPTYTYKDYTELYEYQKRAT